MPYLDSPFRTKISALFVFVKRFLHKKRSTISLQLKIKLGILAMIGNYADKVILRCHYFRFFLPVTDQDKFRRRVRGLFYDSYYRVDTPLIFVLINKKLNCHYRPWQWKIKEKEKKF
jgi:hypothetical protein